MSMMIKDKIELCLKNYDNSCDNIANLFCKKHNFETLTDSNKNTFWVSDERGTILFCNDLYFDMATILTDLKLNATTKELLQWYDYCIENNIYDYNFKTFLLKKDVRKSKI